MIVVSNRVAFPGTTQTGGLAEAMRTLLLERGGLWMGWSGAVSDCADAREQIDGRVRYLTIDLDRQEYADYYGSFANSTLWPLLHGRSDLVRYDDAALHAYLAVNARFAELLAATAQADDTIWIHDYHLIPLAALLRARGVRCRIGFFLHTPVPSVRDLMLLPRHRDLVGALASCDLIGVQTAADAAALAGYLCSELGAAGTDADGALLLGDGRRTRVGAFPIGIDVDGIVALADAAAGSRAVCDLRASLGAGALLIGVDRLDYSKGLPQRIRAFGELLERQPQLRGGVTLLQIAPESRADLPHYRQLGEEVQREVGAVNGRHGDAAWTPVRYVNRAYPHSDLAGFYRLARVGVVTPLRDGMNLVAKEFVAAQDPRDPGVLVLSQFAGAARELDSALLVNPLDTAGCAATLQRALAMPLPERRLRWEAAMERLRNNDLLHWRQRFLNALAASARVALPLLSATATATSTSLPLRRTERATRRNPFTSAAATEVRPGVA